MHMYTVLQFLTSHWNTLSWIKNIFRTISGSNRPRNNNAQPQLKNSTFSAYKKECFLIQSVIGNYTGGVVSN